jgi:hypothetical protein
MSLRIEAALREGFERTVRRNGLLLVAVFVVFGLANRVVTQSANAGLTQLIDSTLPAPTTGGGPGAGGVPPVDAGGVAPLALPIPLPVAILLVVAFAVAAEGIRIVAIRVFASDETETVPPDLARRDIGWAVLNGVVAGVIATVLVGIGLLVLVVPGLFLAVSFYFVRQAVALEDATVFDALSRSWELSKGNRLSVFVLLVVVWLVNLVASLPSGAAFVLTPAVATVLSAIIGGFTTVFGIAVATRAFVQLQNPDTDAEQWDDPPLG